MYIGLFSGLEEKEREQVSESEIVVWPGYKEPHYMIRLFVIQSIVN